MTAPIRIHVPGIPHTATNALFSGCAFTQKVRKLVRLLSESEQGKAPAYEVIHYGNELSDVRCHEHVDVTRWATLDKTYGPLYWTRRFRFHNGDAANVEFRENTNREIRARFRPGDFIFASFGAGHEPVTRDFPGAIVVEPGIGYPHTGLFAPFKVFESYAYMNYCYGAKGVQNPSWYDAVIPNYFDTSDFDYAPEKKQDYLLYIGRIQEDKGLRLYVQLAEQLGFRMIVGGHGRLSDLGIRAPKNVVEVGYCDVEKRRKLMSEARGYLLASQYVEPFGGAAVEAMMSGTPVVTSDFGAFPETVQHGLTGYRCRTLDHFTWAIRNLERIQPAACRRWAVDNYSMARAREMFDEYLDMLHRRHVDPRGWNARDPERGELTWLEKRTPRPWHEPALEPPLDPDMVRLRSRGRRDPSRVTAVTALYDTGREAVDGRRWSDYLSWFERTLALRVPMVVYVHPDMVAFVETAREGRPTRIIPRRTPPGYVHLERIRQILSSPARHPRHPNHVENRSAEYVATVWSKFSWMHEATERNPYASDALVWIDAGTSRFLDEADITAPWPHPSWEETLTSPRVLFEGHGDARAVLRGDRYPFGDLVGTSECLLPAGCWGGSRKALRDLCRSMQGLLEELLLRGEIDNEQVGLALLWSRRPDLFDVRMRPDDATAWLSLANSLANEAPAV